MIRKAVRRIDGLTTARLRAARAERQARGARILVTVVVPMYNVEDYLAECLESILAQSHRRLDVVVVDDGSPDRSIDIARAYASKDRRVRIIRQPNAGLGAARNTGVTNARGEMICFVDSDDSIPANSVETMLRSLIQSGSDFAVGSLLRDTTNGRHMPNWAKEVHATTRQAMRFEDDPDVLKNVFAWTKLYRTEFFRRVVREFPDGLYEDQIPAARAYLHGTFDILKDVVCYWRIRDDGTSITQQKSTMKDLTGRWNMLDELAEEMKDAPADLLRSWQVKTVGFDMRTYYEQVPRTGADYWEFLHQRVRHFVDEVGYDVLREVPVSDRLLAAAVYHGHRDDVSELVSRRESQTWKVPGEIGDGVARVRDEYFDGLDLEADDVLTALDADVALRQQTTSVEFSQESVRVTGSGYLTNISTTASDRVVIKVIAVSGSGAEISAESVANVDMTVDVGARDPWNEHARAAFEVELPVKDLVEPYYALDIEVEVNGLCRRGSLPRPVHRGRGRLPAYGPLTSEGRWCVERQRNTSLLALRRISRNRWPVHGVELDANSLRLDLGTEAVDGVPRARSGSTQIVASTSRASGRTFAHFDLSSEVGVARKWEFFLPEKGRKTGPRLAWAAGKDGADLPRSAVGLLSATQYGNLVLDTGPVLAELDDISLVADGLRVSGWCVTREGTPTLELSGDGVLPAPVDLDARQDGRFTCLVPLVDGHGNPLPLDKGLAICLRLDGESTWPRMSNSLCDSLPGRQIRGDLGIEITATPGAGAAWLELKAPFREEERGRRFQQKLQNAYRSEARPLRDAVVFEAFNGRSVGDSPLALSRELATRDTGIEQYWSVADLRTPVPEWATPLLRFSTEWYELLGTARLLVNNNNWPWYFTKRDGQRYIQTWHGTPLKKIGRHVPSDNLSMTYRRLMEREAQAWDALLAQNEYAAQIFPEAFGYAGPVLTEGYPRNDSLVDGTAARTRAVVREQLELEDDIRVLLYAPTWRDNIKEGARYGRVAFLDFDELAAATGPGTVVLYRGHSNTAASSKELPHGVLDVTHYPDVNELMLAADGLITDYSSIMFDYAVLRRPIYLLVPDLDLYRDTTRGFYRDLEEISPGPLCADTAELVIALDGVDWAEYRPAHDRFLAEFAPRDDGGAAARVLDALSSADGAALLIRPPEPASPRS
ncbi:CDP-glycerol glycerophosphotransferase family protein [Isoptericola halotolerans]|uniref:bifunctional glycosyltransferase/CDP-glycerol:glycerophosphate glycerophosphotransferase n=1 Tax=Isoptericola halotolerans TaxID=300560 RepID=UPI00388F9FFE